MPNLCQPFANPLPTPSQLSASPLTTLCQPPLSILLFYPPLCNPCTYTFDYIHNYVLKVTMDWIELTASMYNVHVCNLAIRVFTCELRQWTIQICLEGGPSYLSILLKLILPCQQPLQLSDLYQAISKTLYIDKQKELKLRHRYIGHGFLVPDNGVWFIHLKGISASKKLLTIKRGLKEWAWMPNFRQIENRWFKVDSWYGLLGVEIHVKECFGCRKTKK